MLTIILSILKIIGIVLLIILSVVLGLVLLLLFCPFNYVVHGDNKKGITGKVTVSWLFSIIRISVLYKDKLNLYIRVFGIKIYDKLRRDKKKELLEAKRKEKSEKNSKPDLSVNTVENITESATDTTTETASDTTAESITDTAIESNAEDEVNNKESSETKKSIFLVIAEIFEKIIDFFLDLPNKIQELIDKPFEKLDSLAETIAYYDKLFSSKGTEKVIELLKKHIGKILGSLRPHFSKVYVRYSSEDPEKSAKMLELYGKLYLIVPKKSKIYIDFDENALDFDITLKGHVLLIIIVWHGLAIILNKNLRKFLKLLKRENKNG